jgi:hypothetical protein
MNWLIDVLSPSMLGINTRRPSGDVAFLIQHLFEHEARS